MKWKIKPEEAKERLDVHISKRMEISRSAAAHMIRRAEASVNGKPAGASYRLKPNDEVTTLPASSRELPAEDGLLSVIEETKDYIVVEKPTSLTVHVTSTRQHGTLANLLLAHYPAIREVGEPHRPGIVHRLDRDVSGIMVVAKTQAAYDYLRSQFAGRKVEKEYAALVLDVIKEDAGTIAASIGRNRKGRMAVKDDGLDAITHFEVLRRGKKSTLLKIKTETGRMHQIRVHLKYISHPIVGDELYAPKNAKVKSRRLMLHALKIGFADMAGNAVSYESPLPEEFKNIP
jgi:23S rRNA pseudouridine1911/1915/1917 synthase